MLDGDPCNGAVHDAGIKEQISKRVGEFSPNRGLPRGGWTIQRDDGGWKCFCHNSYWNRLVLSVEEEVITRPENDGLTVLRHVAQCNPA